MPPIAIIHLIIILESALRPSEIIVYLGNAGLIAESSSLSMAPFTSSIFRSTAEPPFGSRASKSANAKVFAGIYEGPLVPEALPPS